MSLVNYEQMSDKAELRRGCDDVEAAMKEYFSNGALGEESPLVKARILAHFPGDMHPGADVDMLALAYKDGAVVYADRSVGIENMREFCSLVQEKAVRPKYAESLPKDKITKLFHDIENYKLQKLNGEGVARTAHTEQKEPGWKDD
jgi:hypothetical protein